MDSSLLMVYTIKRKGYPDESDGLIHRESIINSALSLMLGKQNVFLNSGRRYFGVFCFQNANVDLELFRRPVPS